VDGGVAAAIYAPSTLVTEVDGAKLAIRQVTDYPFRNTSSLALTLSAPTRFPLYLRIPGWSERLEIRVNGAEIASSPANTFTRLEREWKTGDRVDVTFRNPLNAVAGAYGSSTIQQGPLLFALPITERWEKLRDRAPAADWAVYPESKWNFALKRDAALERVEGPIGAPPFSHANRGLAIRASGVEIANWKVEEESAGPIPQQPVKSESGEPVPLNLVPYASAKLRITAFPTVV